MEPLVDRQLLEKLERLTLQWQRSFNGLVGGHNSSRFAGAGQEFLDHRNFHFGDDLRAVNWRAYMRFERFFLKTFQVEPRVPMRLLIDISASMTAGSGTGGPGEGAPTKFDYARRLAAALIYIGLVRLDTMVIQPFGSRMLEPFLASGGRHRFQPAEAFLRGLASEGKTDFQELARHYLSNYPQRGMAIVISDFLDDGACYRALQYLADFGHELLVVQLWTPEDREPTATGECVLVDSESGMQHQVFVGEEVRRRYVKAFEAHCNELQKIALRNGGRYAGLATTLPLEEALFGALRTSVDAAS